VKGHVIDFNQDLRNVPLIERKQHLCELIRQNKSEKILYAQHIEENGKLLFEEICRNDLEKELLQSAGTASINPAASDG
jgi:hypothetical protein